MIEKTTQRAASAAALALMVVSAAPAAALDSVAGDRRSLGLTVYNNDLALVREVRHVELPQGTSELRFMDVPSAIRPETVSVTAAGGDPFEIVEQNYEYDLLSHEKVLEKYVGRDLTVYVKNDRSGKEQAVPARLLSTNGGLIFEMGDEIALGLPGRVVVPKLPENLIARPTLVWLLESAAGGARDIEAGYLTGAIAWHADYVAKLASDDSTLDLTGWVTIDNRSGASYDDAKLKLVAGDVNVVRPPMPMAEMAAQARDMMAKEAFVERQMFEYHLYELERPATVKDNQQKQIELLRVAAIPLTKHFRAESSFSPYGAEPVGRRGEAQKASVTIEFVNKKGKKGPGRALPKGVVRVYKSDADGSMIFAGEDSIDHTPEGESVELDVGKAFDVVWERKVLSFREISREHVEAEVEVEVRNRKAEDVTVTVAERFPGERELLTSSLNAREPDAFTLEFDVPVTAKSKSTVTYRVRARR